MGVSGRDNRRLSVDTRETRTTAAKGKQEILTHLKALAVPTISKRLDVGDYQFSDTSGIVVVTRKSADLVQSIHDGHFSDELNRCCAFINGMGGGKLVFLYEGPWAGNLSERGVGYFRRAGPQWFRRHSESGTDIGSILGAIIAVQKAGGIVVPTTSIYESAVALRILFYGLDKNTRITEGIPRPPLKWSRQGSKRARLMALWPHLSERSATALLSRHGSIGAIVDAYSVDLDAAPPPPIEGVGPKTIQNLLEVLA